MNPHGGFCLLLAGMAYGLQLLWPITWMFLTTNLLIGVPFLAAQICCVVGGLVFFFGKL